MKKYYVIILCLIIVAVITSCATNMNGSAAPVITAYETGYIEALI